MDNILSWDNYPSTLEINSSDLQGMAANFSKADLGFLQQQEEMMVGVNSSSAGENTLASHDQLLPLPLMNCSYDEDLQVIRNLQTFSSTGHASTSESEQHQHSRNPETTKGDNYQFSSKRKRRDYSDGGFRIIFGDTKRISKADNYSEHSGEAFAQLKEMIYRAAALQPVNLGVEEVVERPKRKNVRISDDPQTVAARRRRERISEKLRMLQRLVPGGNRMDTASMLGEAANYLKFLKAQVIALERVAPVKSGGNPNHYSFPMHASLPFFT